MSLVKHAHHEFDVDQPGKDSWRHRKAGCTEVLVSSGARYALMHELRGDAELTLPEALAGAASVRRSVLVEGYKALPDAQARGLARRRWASRCCIRTIPHILAVATDAPSTLSGCAGCPCSGSPTWTKSQRSSCAKPLSGLPD